MRGTRGRAPVRLTRIQHMLDTLHDQTQVVTRLTAWEYDFLESVQAQWERTGALTAKQAAVLESIYAEKTA